MTTGMLTMATSHAEEVADAVARLGIRTTVQPFDRSRPIDYALDVLSFEDFAIGRARSGSGVVFTPQQSDELLMCYLPLSGPAILQLGDETVAPAASQILLLNSQIVQQAVFEHRHRQIFFSLPVSTVEQQFRERGDGSGRLFFDQLLLEQSDAVGAAMLHFSWLMLDLLADRDLVAMSPVRLRRCRDGFIDLLSAALFRDKNRHYFEAASGASLAQVRRAEEFMRANCRSPISVTDVATHLGVSVRAVQLAFRKQREATPLQVLQRFRLEGLRRELESRPELTVQQIAEAWGFLSAGRLSSRYRAQFGETPLQTWRRVRGRANAA